MGPDQYYQQVGKQAVNDLNNQGSNDELYNQVFAEVTNTIDEGIMKGEIDKNDEATIADQMSQMMFEAFQKGELGNMSQDEFMKRLTSNPDGLPMHDASTDLPQEDITE